MDVAGRREQGQQEEEGSGKLGPGGGSELSQRGRGEIKKGKWLVAGHRAGVCPGAWESRCSSQPTQKRLGGHNG